VKQYVYLDVYHYLRNTLWKNTGRDDLKVSRNVYRKSECYKAHFGSTYLTFISEMLKTGRLSREAHTVMPLGRRHKRLADSQRFIPTSLAVLPRTPPPPPLRKRSVARMAPLSFHAVHVPYLPYSLLPLKTTSPIVDISEIWHTHKQFPDNIHNCSSNMTVLASIGAASDATSPSGVRAAAQLHL